MPLRPTPEDGGTTVAFFRAASYAAFASKSTPLTYASAKATSERGAGHQVRVAGGGPARDPAAVLVLLDEAVDHLARLTRA